MAENKTKSIIAILLVVSIVALTACDDMTIPKSAPSGSSAVSSGGDVEGGHGYGDDDDYVVEFENPSRLFYFTGITHDDMLRYTDDYLYSNVFLERWELKQIYAQDDYLLSNTALGKSEEYIHVYTDTATKSANPQLGDTVTIYGQFVTTDQITWQSGASEIVPTVTAHMLYVNNIIPKDLEDFAAGFVDALNRDSRSYSNENQYISGIQVKILCYIDKFGDIGDPWESFSWTTTPYNRMAYNQFTGNEFAYLRVDGYLIDFGLFSNLKDMSDAIDAMNLGGTEVKITDSRSYMEPNVDLFWVTAHIDSLESADSYGYLLKFEYESIEPAGKYDDYIPSFTEESNEDDD